MGIDEPNSKPDMGRKKRPAFKPTADLFPESVPVQKQETSEERREREDRTSREQYIKKYAPTHNRINRVLEAKGQEPLKIIDPSAPFHPSSPSAPALNSVPVPMENRPSSVKIPTDVIAEQNPNIPKFSFRAVDRLPSKALPYPKGATVKYRAFTFGEMEELANSNISVVDKFLFILRGIEANFDTMMLTLPDTLLIGLLRKTFTLGGEEFVAVTPCTACGKPHQWKFYTAIPEKMIARGIEPEHVMDFEDLSIPALPLKVKLSIGTHVFYPLTISDYLFLLDKDFQVNRLTTLAIQCHSLEFPDSIDVFANMTDIDDVEKLKKVNTMFKHHVKLFESKCDNILTGDDGDVYTCGEPIYYDITNSVQTLVLPFRSEEHSYADDFSFGA